MKSRAAALFAPIREWFLLEQAASTIRGYTSVQHALVGAHVRAANARLRAAKTLVDPLSASVLLRDGILHLLSEQASASSAASFDVVGDDADRASAAITSEDSLYFDRLLPDALEPTRRALERTASSLRRRVDPRSAANVRGTRWGRLTALAVIAAYVIWRILASTVIPHNVALGKPVYPSSYKLNPPDGHELVDGTIVSSFGVHTNTEDSPRVTIDLLATYRIFTVKVYNRGDGWYDDCLPLVVELSADGQNYFPIGRRETHFNQQPPWVIDAHKHQARYVRLRVDRRSYIALSEVEVIGKK
jgi:hypothetical protein